MNSYTVIWIFVMKGFYPCLPFFLVKILFASNLHVHVSARMPFIVLTSFQGFFYFMSWCTSSCSHYGTPYSVHRPFSLWLCWCKFHHNQQIFTVFTGRHWSCDMRLTYKVCNSWHFTVHLKEAVPLTGCSCTLQLGVVLDFVFCIFSRTWKKSCLSSLGIQGDFLVGN